MKYLVTVAKMLSFVALKEKKTNNISNNICISAVIKTVLFQA